MMMNKLIQISIICCSLVILANCGEADIVISDDRKCDGIQCEGSQKVYAEIGCKPVIEDGECCPSRFDCSHLSQLNKTQCHFKNQTIPAGKSLEDKETSYMCHAACFCSQSSSPNDIAYFNCASIECPEYFDEPNPDCIWQTEKSRCCGRTQVCGDDLKKLHQCYLDGNVYYENQWMYPESSICRRCWCDKGWENKTIENNPFCEEIDCGIELMSLGRIMSGCVAVYYKDKRCCPIGWRCPSDGDNVIRHGKAAEQLDETAAQCTFGQIKLNIGDELVSSEDMKCRCTEPPFVDCIQNR